MLTPTCSFTTRQSNRITPFQTNTLLLPMNIGDFASITCESDSSGQLLSNPGACFAWWNVCSVHSGKIVMIRLQSTAMMSFTSTDLPARPDQHLLSSFIISASRSLPLLFSSLFFHVSFFILQQLSVLSWCALSSRVTAALYCWLTLFYPHCLCFCVVVFGGTQTS